jgi:Tol biopolymer transport system component
MYETDEYLHEPPIWSPDGKYIAYTYVVHNAQSQSDAPLTYVQKYSILGIDGSVLLDITGHDALRYDPRRYASGLFRRTCCSIGSRELTLRDV